MNSEVHEVFGFPYQPATSTSNLSPNWQIYYNNYKGLGYRVFVNTQQLKLSDNISGGLGLSFDSQNGTGVEPSFTIAKQFGRLGMKVKAGAGYNSRQGLVDASFSTSCDRKYAGRYDNKYGRSGLSSATSFDLQMDVPSVTMPMRNNVYPIGIHVDPVNGVSAFGMFDVNFPRSITGFYSESSIANNGVVTSNAYGYLYNANSTNSSELKDFQRQTIPYSKKIPNLAPSSFTYDLFSQTGQGSGSQFRPYANNVGVLEDKEIESKSYSYPATIEFGTTAGPMHFGAGFQLSAGTSTSGPWREVGTYDDVDFSNDLNYGISTSPAYQPAPFMAIGNKAGVLSSEDHLAAWGGDEAVKVKLEKSNDPNWFKRQYVARNNFITDEADQNGFQAGVGHKYRNQARERRATNYEIVRDDQVALFGFTKNIGYNFNAGTGQYENDIKTTSGGSNAHHISEITTVQPDGMRYTYGLPAYNNVQYDGSCAVNVSSGNFNTKTVALNPQSGTWQPDVSNTYDQFSQQTETGPYVHSWLLTSVVSNDYVDIQNDGPTQDDYGYWVRFNYERTSDNYYWHVPYEGGNYYEGKKEDPTDDRASYSCGNREQYYLSSVETKTHIAIFYTSVREDGVGAAHDLNGGLPSSITGSDRLYKLDSIKLYTKAEYYVDIDNRELRPYPVAIKTVHFRYSYDLCGKPSTSDPYYDQFENNNTGNSVDQFGNTPASAGPNINVNKGKLTLEKVFFTYQTSERGELSPYVFDYGTGGNGSDDNPYYDPTAVDRWGHYKSLEDFDVTNGKYPYIDNPWTDQANCRKNSSTSNQTEPVAGAWSLKKIVLPSGASIQVDYEADDYAYVEDQKATAMFDIYDLGRSPFSSGSDERQSSTVRTTNMESTTELLYGQYRLYFKLKEAVSTSAYGTTASRSNFIKEKYLNGGSMEKIYFRVFTDLLKFNADVHKDYVSGYAEVEYNDEITQLVPATYTSPFGLASSPDAATNTYDLGYILLKGVKLSSPVSPQVPLVSPLIKASLDHLHHNRPELLHPPAPASATTIPGQITSLLASVATNMNDIAAAMVGFNTWAYTKGLCKQIDLNGRSIIRLTVPDGKKYGGGSRVKKITVNDNWDNDVTNSSSGTDPDNYVYGMEYNYETLEDGEVISSGVCYEPAIGKEESALTQPIEYVHSTLLKSDENLFLETPILESYYPGAQVGYRKVTVTSIAPSKALADDPTNHLYHSSAPITIYEFYTPKEFPILFDQTDINADPSIIRPILIPGIYTSFTKRQARTQGYSIVLNDMAGKLRSTTQRTKPTNNNPNGTLIAKTEYTYFTEEPFSDNKKNKLSSKVQVLMDDGSYQSAAVGQTHDIFIDMNENLESSFGGGLDANLDVSGSVFIPTFFPTINKKELSMRTVVVNKIVNRTGILKEVTATHQASTIKTENIAFDLETGEPLLTKTYNEHKDPVYSYSYPGHWYYDGLQGGYINQGMVIDNFISTGPTASPMQTSGAGRINNIDDYLDGLTTDEVFEPGDEIYVDLQLTLEMHDSI